MPNNVRDDIIEVFEAISKAQLTMLRRLRSGGRKEIEPSGARPTKSMSHIDMVYNILIAAQRPLHISEILALVEKRHGMKLDRESVVSALAKRIARKDRFVRTAPNTFSIMPGVER